MNLQSLSRNLKSAHVLLTKIQHLTPTLISNQQRICTRHLSSSEESRRLIASDTHNGSENSLTLQKFDGYFSKDQEELFADAAYFQTPVLMLHCSWTDFAVSFHAPDKLDELDCLWSCFPCDLKIYGMKQRLEPKTVHLILVRAKKAMENYGVTKCRVVFKGYNGKTLMSALAYLETLPFEYISLTDLTRKIGEESMVYQRPVPRYPHHKLPIMRAMLDGPDVSPKTLIDKFRRLNVKWVDVEQKGQGLSIKSTEAKASKRGFILKKSQAKGKEPPPKNLLAPLDPPS